MKKISKILHNTVPSDQVVLNVTKTIVKPPKSPKPEKPKKERKKPTPLYNEEGVRVNKDGSISKAGKGIDALRKWRENQKKLKEEQKMTVAPQVESEDEESDPEYEIEDIEIKKPKPIVVEKEVVKEVIKEVEKPVEVEIVKPDLLVLKENEELKQKNKKLQESFKFNEHLSRISNMAKVTSLKF